MITCPTGAIFVSPKIFMHQSKFIFHTTMIVFSVTNFLYEHKFANIQAGYVHIFLQKYECYKGKNTSADSQIFNFSKMARIAFLTMVKRFRTPFLTL